MRVQITHRVPNLYPPWLLFMMPQPSEPRRVRREKHVAAETCMACVVHESLLSETRVQVWSLQNLGAASMEFLSVPPLYSVLWYLMQHQQLPWCQNHWKSLWSWTIWTKISGHYGKLVLGCYRTPSLHVPSPATYQSTHPKGRSIRRAKWDKCPVVLTDFRHFQSISGKTSARFSQQWIQ